MAYLRAPPQVPRREQLMSEKIQAFIQKTMQRRFGEAATMTADDLKAMSRITYGVSAQCLSLDLIIGRPGFPAGRLIEICAPEGSAKSMHGYHLLAETQRLGGIGVLIETEQAFEEERLSGLGIQTEDLLLSQPQHLEDAFSMIETHITLLRDVAKFQGPVTVVFDSIAGTPSSSEVEKGYDERGMAAGARVISQALRKLITLVARHKIVLVFLNQLRSTMNPYAEPFTSYGGAAIKYHASLRLQFQIRKSENIRDNDKVLIGTRLRARTIKNKLNLPFQDTAYTIYYRTGIDPYLDLLSAGVKIGFLEGQRGRFSFKGYKFTQDDWPKIVQDKLKGPHALRDRMTTFAIAKGALKPYASATPETDTENPDAATGARHVPRRATKAARTPGA